MCKFVIWAIVDGSKHDYNNFWREETEKLFVWIDFVLMMHIILGNTLDTAS